MTFLVIWLAAMAVIETFGLFARLRLRYWQRKLRRLLAGGGS